jgi:5-methylcytosine-specific restriction protein A
MPDSLDFRSALIHVFTEALEKGLSEVIVVSGDLHRAVGGYPGKNHRMPNCCQVMYQHMGPDDTVIEAPPNGNGATLKILYRLKPNN